MAQQFWLNLPVKDIQRSKAFFSEMGFRFNPRYQGGDNSACLLIGDKDVVVMLFEESFFKGCTGNEVADANRSNEVLLSIDVQSKEEVDEMARKAIAAGGSSTHQPGEMKSWMYGCVFADVDGHRWNVLYMDQSQMQQG